MLLTARGFVRVTWQLLQSGHVSSSTGKSKWYLNGNPTSISRRNLRDFLAALTARVFTPVFRTLSRPSTQRQRRRGTERVFSAMAYTRHHSYPHYFYYGQGARLTAPAYASKGNRPSQADIKNIRLKTSDYYLARINADRRNRVMDQRSDYLFVDHKPGGVGAVIESRDSCQ